VNLLSFKLRSTGTDTQERRSRLRPATTQASFITPVEALLEACMCVIAHAITMTMFLEEHPPYVLQQGGIFDGATSVKSSYSSGVEGSLSRRLCIRI
jgi:hypothetical protein